MRTSIVAVAIAGGLVAWSRPAHAHFVLVAPDGGLRTIRSAGFTQRGSERIERMPRDARTHVAEAVRTRWPVWIESAADCEQRFPDAPAHDDGCAAWAALPLVVVDQAMGALLVGFAQARSFEDMCAVASGRRVAFRDSRGGRPADLTIWTVTANTFGLLGVRPMLGRDFVQADEAAVEMILNAPGTGDAPPGDLPIPLS